MTRKALDGDDIFTLADFLTAGECAGFVAHSERVGYRDALLGGEVVKEFRDNDRLLHDDAALADRLLRRAAPFLPSARGGRPLVGFNERFRLYRYGPRQSFKPHFDGSYHRFEMGEASELTFLIYLNDDFAGGTTVFHDDFARYAALGGVPRLRVAPVRARRWCSPTGCCTRARRSSAGRSTYSAPT